MPRRLISLGGATSLLDIASYARRGPGYRDHLSRDEIELITRTVRRTPEVMVKVLSHGGQNLKAVGRHLAYLDRRGEIDIETDDGQHLSGRGVEQDLLENWDLDLEERRGGALEYWSRRTPPKLVHKLIFSMPPGTPPDRLFAAVKNFAREEFALRHRYAMVLHTDEPHPHVHMVVKAVSEQGERLNIRKATLRQWRSDFARHLRAVGVPANATHRSTRGETAPRKPDGIHRANLRGQSSHTRARAGAVARELANGRLQVEPGKVGMLRTRSEILHAWRAVSDILVRQGEQNLAGEVRQFLERMPSPVTEKEWIAGQLLAQARKRSAPERSYPSR